ncbi:MAG: RES family NAD+ phosphorylase [Rhodospirillales bacterium]|nr:RES family NAD+ phosphorylase [Rhodospirillales bacterium]
MVADKTPPISGISWSNAYRIIRSLYPPLDLFEDIADPSDWDLIISAEMKTNPRVREQAGDISLIPVERRVSGTGATLVMAPFTHFSRDRPTRFSDGSFGIFYAGDRFEVALKETIFHYENFMRRTAEPASAEDFRELVGIIDHNFHDLRGEERFTDCLDPDSYGVSQALGRRLRDEGSDGIVYPSVRHPAGDAVAAFWPDVVNIPVQGRHFQYQWNGERVERYFVIGEEDWRELPM